MWDIIFCDSCGILWSRKTEQTNTTHVMIHYGFDVVRLLSVPFLQPLFSETSTRIRTRPPHRPHPFHPSARRTRHPRWLDQVRLPHYSSLKYRPGKSINFSLLQTVHQIWKINNKIWHSNTNDKREHFVIN